MKRSEIIIRIPNTMLNLIKNDLRRPHDFAFERIGFIGSRHKVLSTGTTIIFMTDYFPVPDNQYINDPDVGARINSTAIRESLQRIIDHKIGVFHTHYHTFSANSPEFSFTDMKDNPEIIKSFGYADKKQVHGMIVLGNSEMNALVKIPGESELRQVTRIIGVGYPMTISIPAKTIERTSKKRYDRQSFLGKNAQLVISQVRVCIVGLGGGGSHIVQQLAHLGIKNYTIFDYDKVDETNLNRLIGAGLIDVTNGTKKVDVARTIIESLHKDANIKIVDDNWMNTPANLQECDVVFGCVDSYIARRDLESECRRYMIPLIDIGMDVHDGYENEAPSMAGQIILSIPGEPCMHCLGFLTEPNLAREAAKYGAAGGRPQVVWANGVLASQTVGIFVDLITGWSGKTVIMPYYSFDGNSGILMPHPRLKYTSNTCEHYTLKNVGLPVFKKV